MSVEALTAVLHHSRAAGTDKLVLIGIANHSGDGGAWPTVSTLARYANTTERTVQRSVGKLVQLGELHVHKQAGGSQHLHAWERPNRYDVLVTCPATCDRTSQHRVRYPQPDAELPGVSDSARSDRVTPASPGDTSVTGGGDTSVTQTVHVTQPVRTSLPNVTTTREASELPPGVVVHSSAERCDVCQLSWSECTRAAKTSGHTFRPKGAGTCLTDECTGAAGRDGWCDGCRESLEATS